MFEQLKNLSVEVDKNTIVLLEKYISLFNEYNDKINLMSKNDVNIIFEKHIYDSLAINLFLEKYKINKNAALLDIGTGGGFPSLPIAMFFKDINVYALDSIKKKLNFIDSTADILDLKNINTIYKRAEDLPKSYRNKFNIAVSRATAELRVILEYAIPYVQVDGFFVAYKSKKAKEEIHNAQNAIRLLNTKLIDTIEYELPIKEENKRVLLVFKKEKNTDIIYPRQNGQIKKKPL